MFLPTEEQRQLQQGIRDVLDGVWPPARLADPAPETPEQLRTVWGPLADAGLWELRGGLGLGLADAVLVFEELGRALVPGPLVATFLLAAAHPGPVTAAFDPGLPVVTDLAVSDAVAVVGTDQVRLVPAARLDVTRLEPLDPFASLHRVGGWPEGPHADIDPSALVRDAAVLTAALQVGIAARLTEMAVEYARTREQFGRPIGGFQAVKHLCADMYARTELARVAVQAAAVTVDDPEVGDPARAVAGAKLLADEAATGNGRACVQVHGGMGFTWEVPVHFYLKRAWRHATEWLTVDDAAARVADRLLAR